MVRKKPGSARPEGTPAMDPGLEGIRTHMLTSLLSRLDLHVLRLNPDFSRKKIIKFRIGSGSAAVVARPGPLGDFFSKTIRPNSSSGTPEGRLSSGVRNATVSGSFWADTFFSGGCFAPARQTNFPLYSARFHSMAPRDFSRDDVLR